MTDLLRIRNLAVRFGDSQAVNHVDFDIAGGEVVAVVGESGSGKSITMMAAMGLIDAPGVVTADEITVGGVDLLHAKPAMRRKIVGKEIAMIFQDALTSLNPSLTIGYQIREILVQHTNLRGAALDARILELLDQVRIADAKKRRDAYPHELSGGMNQRAMIAMAIACKPRLLIADEPTTALDVTVQAQVMRLLEELQREYRMGLVLISHDLAVVAEIAHRVAVMYAGEVIETGPVPRTFEMPRHPYTRALLGAIPERARDGRMTALPGNMPLRRGPSGGCLFAPRCAAATDACRVAHPELTHIDAATEVRCVLGTPAGMPKQSKEHHAAAR